MTKNNTQKGVLVDLTRCIGCRACQVACKSWNQQPVKKTFNHGTYTNPPALNSSTYTHIQFLEGQKDDQPVWHFIKDQCLHCKDPACASACPVKALWKTEAGPVIYEFSRCIGCRYCMVACPFDIPKYEWEKALPAVRKCTFCSDRIADGQVPACIKVCPVAVMFYGEREDVLKEAEKRLRENPGKYVDHIYGKEEAGGTSWVYLSAVPFDALGFNRVQTIKYPDLTWAYISTIPSVIGVVITAGVITWAITRRQKAEKGEKP